MNTNPPEVDWTILKDWFKEVIAGAGSGYINGEGFSKIFRSVTDKPLFGCKWKSDPDDQVTFRNLLTLAHSIGKEKSKLTIDDYVEFSVVFY